MCSCRQEELRFHKTMKWQQTIRLTGKDNINGNEELTEEEVEEFIRSEQQAASEGNNAQIESRYTPQIGMQFKNRDDAHHFF